MGKQQKHLQGRRGEAFVRLIRGIPREQIICVSIDVHKYYHLVMIHNDYGDILACSFKIDIFKTGFDRLCMEIDRVLLETGARVHFIGMEPTGHYFENLARYLGARYPHIRLVNSFAVSKNRDQKMLRRQKTDEIDLCAIGDLVLRNECFAYRPLSGDYLHLQHWVRYRRAKIKARTALRNQVIGHLDRIFPGLVRPNREAQGDYPQLFADFWTCETAQHLIQLCPNPRDLVGMQPQGLMERFHAHGWRMGPITGKRIIDFAHQVLLPPPEVIAARLPLLKLDLPLLEALDQAISEADKQIAHYLSQTRGQILTHVKGIGIFRAASYVAGIGNPEHYEHAGQTFKRSGLVSGRADSGIHQRGGAGRSVTKVGDSHLRTALVEMAHGLCHWQPYFGNYKASLEARGKHRGVAAVATARKVNGVLFALMRDQTEFRPTDAHGDLIPPRTSLGEKGKATTDIDSSKADSLRHRV